MAEDNQVMTMKDWINETDSLFKFRKYEKYKVIQDKKFISDFDRLLLGTENINKNKIED